jgi:prepilin-type N-terminal cleavage/methylation domain-containing protein
MNKLKFKRTIAGFSLPEVLVALSIFAVVGVVFTAALGTNFKVLVLADQRTTAESLAKAKLEAIDKAAYYSTYDNVTISIPSGYAVSTAVVYVDPLTGLVSSTDVGMQKVTVTVTFPQRSPPEVIVISSYKRNPEKIG